jgi:hypothetical protein
MSMSIKRILRNIKGRTGIEKSILITGTAVCLSLSSMIVADFRGAASAEVKAVKAMDVKASDIQVRHDLDEMVLIFDSSHGRVQFEVSGDVDLNASWGRGASHCDGPIVGAQLVACDTSASTTVVRLSGQLERFGPSEARAHKGVEHLLSVRNWGDVEIATLENAFWGARRLQEIPSELPKSVVSLKNAFRASGYAGSEVSAWDVSDVFDLSYVFAETTAFNASLSDWDTSGVSSFEGTFKGSQAFSQPLSWDVSSGENFSKMFAQSVAFNADIGAWDVSKGKNFAQMFDGAVSFDRDIAKWDVSSARDMTRMFAQAMSFNQDLSAWCVAQFVQVEDNHLVGAVEVGHAPSQFDAGASSWEQGRPVWGECPDQSDLTYLKTE